MNGAAANRHGSISPAEKKSLTKTQDWLPYFAGRSDKRGRFDRNGFALSQHTRFGSFGAAGKGQASNR